MQTISSYMLRLAETDSRFYFVFDISSNKFLFLNGAFERFFQTTLQKVSIDVLLKFVTAEDRDYLLELYQSKLKVFKDVDFRIKLPGKPVIWLRLNGVFSNVESSKTITGYLEDISAIRAHDDTLNEYSNKKNAVLSILAHDLSGPIGSIEMLSGIIAKLSLDLPDQSIFKFITQIQKVSADSSRMLKDFLDVEFMESAKVNLVIKRTNLSRSLKTLIQGYHQTELSHQLKFVFTCSEEDIYVELDEAKFLQAINNLVSNAIKFTRAGGIISIELKKTIDKLLIIVKDTGVGIPKKFQSSLFEKFNAARRPGLNGESSVGLGMSVVKTIVNWHQGKIWFESEENNGTTFYIELNGS
jgi:two-component system sensor histidine kinase VicK